MKDFYHHLSLNKKLALLALLLAFFALFAGSPYRGADVSINTKDLALIVEKEVDHVTVGTLADWIIQGKSDFRLVDLRNEKEYAEYHIPSAENITPSGLERSTLLRNEKIILYSDGGIHAAQAWMLLRANGYKGVYTLQGGLEEWKHAILFPRIPENPTPEQAAAFAKAKEVSKFFGGAPQSGAAGESSGPRMTMPKPEMPSPSAVGVAKKKKKEGC